MSDPTPWRNWLELAVSLGLAPGEFWRLTMCEWRMLMSRSETAPLSRASLNMLMMTYPDDNDA